MALSTFMKCQKIYDSPSKMMINIKTQNYNLLNVKLQNFHSTIKANEKK